MANSDDIRRKMPENRSTDDSYKTSEQFQKKDIDADPEMLDRQKMRDSVQKR